MVIAYEALGAAIKAGDGIKQAAATFFSEAEDAPMTELKQAGYLLSVAFKIDGKIPPEKIQQVKDHKAMMKDVGKIKDAAKDAAKASAAYATASASINTWLEGVDLPALGDKAWDPRGLETCSQPAIGPCIRASIE